MAATLLLLTWLSQRHAVVMPPTLIILPGTDGTGDLLTEFTAALAPNIDARVIRYPTDRAFGYAELQTLIEAALPTAAPYVLLAESFSGPLAIAIAARRPPGLAGVVLCASFACFPSPLRRAARVFVHSVPVKRVPLHIASVFLLGRWANATWRERLRATLARLSPIVLKHRALEALRVDVRPLLEDIGVPVLYLRARSDRLLSASAAETLARGVPVLRVVELNAPHFILQAAPVEAAHAVVHFIAEINRHA